MDRCTPTTEKDAPATSSTSPTVNPAAPGSVCKQVVDGVCIR
jgi:hypothetical protein